MLHCRDVIIRMMSSVGFPPNVSLSAKFKNVPVWFHQTRELLPRLLKLQHAFWQTPNRISYSSPLLLKSQVRVVTIGLLVASLTNPFFNHHSLLVDGLLLTESRSWLCNILPFFLIMDLMAVLCRMLRSGWYFITKFRPFLFQNSILDLCWLFLGIHDAVCFRMFSRFFKE